MVLNNQFLQMLSGKESFGAKPNMDFSIDPKIASRRGGGGGKKF
jgi:hypothetical protein